MVVVLLLLLAVVVVSSRAGRSTASHSVSCSFRPAPPHNTTTMSTDVQLCPRRAKQKHACDTLTPTPPARPPCGRHAGSCSHGALKFTRGENSCSERAAQAFFPPCTVFSKKSKVRLVHCTTHTTRTHTQIERERVRGCTGVNR